MIGHKREMFHDGRLFDTVRDRFEAVCAATHCPVWNRTSDYAEQIRSIDSAFDRINSVGLVKTLSRTSQLASRYSTCGYLRTNPQVVAKNCTVNVPNHHS